MIRQRRRPANLARPGRIDKAIELGYMDPEDKKETPAQFQEACAQMALALLWGERKRRTMRVNGWDEPSYAGALAP